MTAKDTQRKLFIAISRWKANVIDSDELKEIYKQHCTHLCREQRELVLKACKFSSDGDYYYASKNDILNCQEPEV